MSYAEFLNRKRIVAIPSGFDADESDLHPDLFDFQRRIVATALQRGKSAIFADTGLGKTLMEAEWARRVHERTGQKVLAFAPLAVAQQTVREAAKFGIEISYAKDQVEVSDGITVTNYDRLERFDPAEFGGVVLDESSILKAYGGDTRKKLTAFARNIPFRLCATATPAPNDWDEIINHAEFLSIMGGKEIQALYFTQDGNSSHKWKLKGHGQRDFWKWMASWSVALRKPSDLGFSDDGYLLPDLRKHQITVEAEASSFSLFPVEALTLAERRKARRDSLEQRVARAAEIANACDGPFLAWCDLNAESAALVKSINGAVEVKGSDSPEAKERAILGFMDGSIRCLVTKPSICGFGLNWQHCHRMAFVGLSDSFEQLYQAIRRCWRFGQTEPVDVWIITAETEGAVLANIARKERQMNEMFDALVRAMDEFQGGQVYRGEMDYQPNRGMILPKWLKEKEAA